ncbi:MAG: hypothetical protein ABH821_04550 [archaeon]
MPRPKRGKPVEMNPSKKEFKLADQRLNVLPPTKLETKFQKSFRGLLKKEEGKRIPFGEEYELKRIKLIQGFLSKDLPIESVKSVLENYFTKQYIDYLFRRINEQSRKNKQRNI